MPGPQPYTSLPVTAQRGASTGKRLNPDSLRYLSRSSQLSSK
jgi:hypothetical protein